MSFRRNRIARLEARQRRQHRPERVHFISIVRYPWRGAEPEADWLRSLVCPCGQRACPQLRIGALLPEKAPSAEAWAAEVRRYQERQRYELSQTG